MTQTEIKAKIADWESRLKNPSVASVPSAVAKINSIIDDLKSKLEAEKPKEKAPKKEKKAKAEKGIKPKFKIGDLVDVVYGEENGKSGEITKVYSYELYPKSMKSDSIPYYEIEGMSKDISESNLELSKKEAKADKKESKKSDYDCDDLIKEAKERHAKAKKAAEVRAEAPKKTEATKDKEKIEKVYDNVEKHIEKNKLSKAQLEKLIAETKDLLKLLEKALKNL
jgi:hypothetical protein